MSRWNSSGFFTSPLLSFSLIIFLVSVGDAIMSYLSPVYIESYVSNSLIMGIVISFSSLIGLLCDLYFPKFFSGRGFAFFSWLTLLAALIFPAAFILLPPVVTVFLVGMAAWGIYYELLHFSQFHFISRFLPGNQFARGWGILTAFKSAAYLVGPLIAVFILPRGFSLSFTSALLFFLAAGFGLWLFTKTVPQKHPASFTVSPTKLPISHVFRVWYLLWKKIWPLYIFLFFLSVIDSTFWTIGTILSEQLRTQSFIGGLLLPAYSLPALFVTLFAQKAASRAGKKRAAFITAAVSGLILLPIGFVSSAPILVGTVFLASLFLSLSFPEIFAVFEDYVKRLGKSGDEMIGLQASAVSLSYILGPIITGAIAEKFGPQLTFTVVGALLFVISLAAIVIVPRKIRLPEAQIATS
jgi:MFS family permease